MGSKPTTNSIGKSLLRSLLLWASTLVGNNWIEIMLLLGHKIDALKRSTKAQNSFACPEHIDCVRLALDVEC